MVEDMFIGDNATFDGQISGPNTILLYPRKGANVGVDTNIIIFGRSGNRYVFYVKSEGVNTERLTNSIIDVDVIDGPAGSRGAGVSGSRSNGGGGGMNASSYKRGGVILSRWIQILLNDSIVMIGLKKFLWTLQNLDLILKSMFQTLKTW